MHEHQRWMLFILSTILIFSFSVQPSLALIDVEHNSVYDANSESGYPGEEIDVTITIEPGGNDVSDMQIKVSGATEALIDYGKDSFEATILPAGEVGLTKTDISATRTYECERLKPGEMIKLRFRAYPKTIRDGEIDTANVKVTYTQLGERLSRSVHIKADLEDSSWFELKSIEDKVKNSQTMMYAGIILATIAGISLVTQWIGKGKREKEKDAVKRNWRKNLKDVSKKIELAKDNPTEMESLERLLNRDIESINVKGQTKKSTDRRKKRKA